mgnify:CR=1 FL=1
MDFALDKKYEMAQNLFREFAQNEVKPLAQEIDENHRFPRETVEKMAKYGFLGIPVSKEDGGQGCDPLTYVMCVEELSKVCGTTGVIVSAHTSLCVDPIQTYGTPDQKAKYLPDLASGRKLGAFGLTEPGAGTDAQGQQTKAVLDGDEWVLNGSKCFITNGKEADVYIIIAVTGTIEKRGRKQKEISAFIVEKGTPGFTFGTRWVSVVHPHMNLSSQIVVFLRMHFSDRRARDLVLQCIHLMVVVLVSQLRLLVLLRVLLISQSTMLRKESSLVVQSLSSRILSLYLLILQQRLKQLSYWYTRQLRRKSSIRLITRLHTL